MKAGSIGSRLFTVASLFAILGGVVGLYGMVLHGSPSPVEVVPSRAKVQAALPGLSEDDVASTARLDQVFREIGYQLEPIRSGRAEVPPLFLARVPADLDDLADADAKKEMFVRVLLPLLLAVNEEIAEDRSRLQALLQRKAARQPLSRAETLWLSALASRYQVEDGDLGRLLRRVDVVPPSLALAQAAVESGWGTSRLGRRSHNIFGHIGDVSGEEISMRHFGSLDEAVRAYVHNLNTHRAYDGLRRARAKARARGVPPDGMMLSSALNAYSERGEVYVGALRGLMRANDLVAYDSARLGRAVPMRFAALTQ